MEIKSEPKVFAHLCNINLVRSANFNRMKTNFGHVGHLFFFFSILLCLLVALVKAGDDCLSGHNRYRALHGVPALEFHPTLEQYAMKRARYMAQTDIFAHPPNLPYGENLYWKKGRKTTCEDALASWYKEIKYHSFKNGGFSPTTGHFTQMVWSDTEYLGCASAKSRNTGRVYIACNYYPPGNVRGQFKSNVPPPLKKYADVFS